MFALFVSKPDCLPFAEVNWIVLVQLTVLTYVLIDVIHETSRWLVYSSPNSLDTETLLSCFPIELSLVLQYSAKERCQT